MSDIKYARVFTQEDVLAIVRECMESNAMGTDDTQTIIDSFEGRFPVDEPQFVLRGQDRMALGTVRHYRELCDVRGVSNEHRDGVDEAISDFESFRVDNPDRMKDPD